LISRLVVTAVVAPMLTACVGDRPPSSVFERDSAGITIVESTSSRWSSDEGWLVDTTPLLDLTRSGTGPPHEFYRVRDAMRLPDGSIVVADYGSQEVRFFSSSGAFLGAVGREGEGPGEFSRLTSVDRFRGDSLIAFDYWLGRITVLSPGWEVSRIISPYQGVTRMQELHPLGDVAFIAMLSSYESMEGSSGLFRVPSPIVRLSSAGKATDTLTTIPGFETFIFTMGDARPLFAKAAHLAVHQEQFYLGTADRMQFEVYSATGRLERIVRVPHFDLHLSSQELSDEREDYASRIPPNAPPAYRDLLEAMPDPETRPAYSDLLVDAEGYVWAAESHGRAELDEPTDWEVFGPEGEWFGSVRLPARFTVFEIGSDYVLGRLYDDLDVEHVQVLHLHRR
jgi:hypothetical protein